MVTITDDMIARACAQGWDAFTCSTGTAVHPMFSSAFEYGYRAALAAQPAEPVAWIPVTERLPDPDSGEVLVWLSGGMYALEEWHTHREDPTGMSTTHTLDMGCMWRHFDFEEVTHWMPLPSAPGAAALAAQPAERSLLSWSGFNIEGDRASVEAVKQALHEAGTVPAWKERVRHAEAALTAAAPQPAGDVTITRREDGSIAAVTRTDDDGRVLSVIAECQRKPQPQRVPLTQQQVADLFRECNRESAKLDDEGRYEFAAWFGIAVRLVERAHGIGGEPPARVPLTLPPLPEPEALGMDFDQGWDGVLAYGHTDDALTGYARTCAAAWGVPLADTEGGDHA